MSNKNWSSYLIQEIPEYSNAIAITMEHSMFDKTYVKESSELIDNPFIPQLTIALLAHERKMSFMFDENYRPIVERFCKSMLQSLGAINVQVMFAKLIEDKYLPIDGEGTKMQYALLGLVAKNDKGEQFSAPPSQLSMLGAQLGFLPPITMPMPYSTVNMLEEGKLEEARESLSWLETKPGNLLKPDVKATYALREFAPGNIYGSLNETIRISDLGRKPEDCRSPIGTVRLKGYDPYSA